MATAGSAAELLQQNVTVLAAATAVLLLLVVVLLVSSSFQPRVFLTGKEFQKLTLADKRNITHNTVFFRFALPHRKMRLGLPIGQHLSFLMKDQDGKDVYRSYTPVSDDAQLGFVDFVIKVYPQGKMSQILNNLNPGDEVGMKGPRGRFQYQPNMKRAFGMIAGGTGITPMYQVARAVLLNAQDSTSLSLIFGNITEEDILLRDEWEQLIKEYPDRLKVYYALNSPPEGWKGGVGFITADMIREHLPAPAGDIMVLRCGPTPMNIAMKKHLDDLGYTADMQFEF